ncbi:MAG TPA: DUF2520 domain-containing protein [Candidatus Acidoferrales bacterium]|nr:DUF2520 domain-containing protein [Candidatus Acidoferrales bacterium]
MTSTIAIVGAGRVGRALGRKLRDSGWTIAAVVARSKSSARSAVRAIGAGRPQHGLSWHVFEADIILIATPDDEIHAVAAKLAQFGREECRGKVAIHTSGALDNTTLDPLARAGAATASMHPMQTFGGRGAPPLDGVAFVIQGHRRAQAAARKIVHALGGVPIALAPSAKPAYHAAGNFASGYLLTVIETAIRVLMSLGFSRRRAKMAVLPLIHQTLANFERFGAHAAWTGPISRGDFATVSRHAHSLAAFPKEYQQAYAALARLSARVLAARPKQTFQQLNRVLSKR